MPLFQVATRSAKFTAPDARQREDQRPSTMYYGQNKVFFQMYKGLPQLLFCSMDYVHHVPVDQKLVRVAKEDEHLVFFYQGSGIACNIHALFWPFLRLSPCWQYH